MRTLASAIMAAGLMSGAMTTACADEAIGKISKLEKIGRTLVLADGTTFVARQDVELLAFTIGEKVAGAGPQIACEYLLRSPPEFAPGGADMRRLWRSRSGQPVYRCSWPFLFIPWTLSL